MFEPNRLKLVCGPKRLGTQATQDRTADPGTIYAKATLSKKDDVAKFGLAAASKTSAETSMLAMMLQRAVVVKRASFSLRVPTTEFFGNLRVKSQARIKKADGTTQCNYRTSTKYSRKIIVFAPCAKKRVIHGRLRERICASRKQNSERSA